jgi:hypothetical protein
MQGTTVPSSRQDPQQNGEQEDEHKAEPKRWHGLAQDGKDAGGTIQDAAATHGRIDTDGHAEGDTQNHGDNAQLDRGRESFPQMFRDRSARQDRGAKITQGDIFEVSATLVAKWRYSNGSWVGSQQSWEDGPGAPIRSSSPFLSGEGMRSVARLIHAAIDLQAVTAAINDVDQALGVKLDRGLPPQKALNFAILGNLALLHVVRVGW